MTEITLFKDGKVHYFETVKEASEYLKRDQSSVSNAIRRHNKCNGWLVCRGYVKFENAEVVKPVFRAKDLPMNKTELEYYGYRVRRRKNEI